MKFISLDGKEVKKDINYRKYKIRGEEKCRSKWQYRVGNILAKIFPYTLILEELKMRQDKLKLDFFIPLFRIAIECDGGQHDKFNKFFHGDIDGFQQQKSNDKKKEKWCELNNITLVRIKYPEDDADKIKEAVYNAFGGEKVKDFFI